MPVLIALLKYNVKKRIFFFLIILLLVFIVGYTNLLAVSLWPKNSKLKRISNTCVYIKNDHAAFTTLIEWKGKMLLAFREAESHNASSTSKGKIKVLRGDGRKWVVAHTFSIDGVDLRDPNLVKWNGRLFIYTSGWYSELKNTGWTALKRYTYDVSHGLNIWKIRPYRGKLYGVGNSNKNWPILLSSEDGEHWKSVEEYKLGGNASEADLYFDRDTMYLCIRVDIPTGSNSLWGRSVYPFKHTEWKMMDVSVASPELTAISDDSILLAGREYDYHRQDGKDVRYVSLFLLNKEGKIMENYRIDDGNLYDKGYPGICKYKGVYYMSYYTGKEQTEIRMLKFK